MVNMTGTKGKQDVILAFQSALKLEFIVFMGRLNKHDFKLNSEHQWTPLAQTLSLNRCIFLGKKASWNPRNSYEAICSSFLWKGRKLSRKGQWGHTKRGYLHPRVWFQGSAEGQISLCFPPLPNPGNSHHTDSQQLCNNSWVLEAGLAQKELL